MSATMKQTCVSAPHTPRISTSTLQSSDLHYDGLSTERFSRPSAVSLTDTRHSSYLKREPWLDLSFLGRASSLEDYLCNYWRYAVADGQDISLSHFLDYAPSCVTLPEVETHWARYDDWSWQPGGWHHGQTGAQWRLGHIESKAPDEAQIGGDVYVEGYAYHGVIGDSPPDRRRSNMHREQDPKHHRPLTRRNAFYKTRPIVSRVTSTGFIADIPPADTNPSNEASINIPRSVSTPMPHPTQYSSMESNHGFYLCTPSSMQIPRTTSSRPVKSAGHTSSPIRHCLSESSISTYNPSTPSSIPQKVSGAPLPVLDRNRKYAHHPSNITTPAPLAPTQPSTGPTSWDPHSVQPQEADNAVVRNSRYRKMLRFFCVSSASLGCNVVR